MLKKISPINLCKKLFPINRSLTGKGNRKTLSILRDIYPDLQIKSFKSNTKVLTGLSQKNGMLKKHIS